MKTDKYGQLIFNQNDLSELFLTDPARTITNALVETDIKFNDFLSLENVPNLTLYENSNLSIERRRQIRITFKEGEEENDAMKTLAKILQALMEKGHLIIDIKSGTVTSIVLKVTHRILISILKYNTIIL